MGLLCALIALILFLAAIRTLQAVDFRPVLISSGIDNLVVQAKDIQDVLENEEEFEGDASEEANREALLALSADLRKATEEMAIAQSTSLETSKSAFTHLLAGLAALILSIFIFGALRIYSGLTP